MTRAALIATTTFALVLGGLLPLFRSTAGLERTRALGLASVPAGLLCAGGLALAGLLGVLHPWPPLPAAASGLAPIAAMLLVGFGVPAIRSRRDGAEAPRLPPLPLPDKPGRLPAP
ncbi:MAG: hypothetical protein VX265_18920, partial [Myxococcota bacterium]|nr:hypothetical protein [Myxococcota bacterium]